MPPAQAWSKLTDIGEELCLCWSSGTGSTSQEGPGPDTWRMFRDFGQALSTSDVVEKAVEPTVARSSGVRLVPGALELIRATRSVLVNASEHFAARRMASLVGFEPTTRCLEARTARGVYGQSWTSPHQERQSPSES